MRQTENARSVLTSDNDLSKTDESIAVVQAMEAALAAGSNNMADFFHTDFRWMGNAGCGQKNGLAEFRTGWQLPLRDAFTDRDYITRAWVAQGEWVSCFGSIEATHSGEFMGIAATGKRVTIPYTDFWQILDRKIADNWVNVDFPHVLRQLGRDVFDGDGWESIYRADET